MSAIRVKVACVAFVLGFIAPGAIGVERPLRMFSGFDECVIVNHEEIIKRDVTERMGDVEVDLMRVKGVKIRAGKWTPEEDVDWTKTYVDAFRAALRQLVREKLMIQQFESEKLTLDENDLQRRLDSQFDRLNRSPLATVELYWRTRDEICIEVFRKRFNGDKSREEAWFREALKKSPVMQSIGGNWRPLPVEFFFPDEWTPEKEAEARQKSKEFEKK